MADVLVFRRGRELSSLCIAPIVEGHGEVVALPRLLERIWHEIVGGDYIEVLQPVRQPRSKLLDMSGGESVPNTDELRKAVEFAQMKLRSKNQLQAKNLILLILDADRDCPKDLAPQLQETIQTATGVNGVAVVLANTEYETWFVAAAESLKDYLQVSESDVTSNPETQRSGKGWIEKRFRGVKYSETVDQVRLTSRMDIKLCRRNSPSFDKLCRELEARASSADQQDHDGGATEYSGDGGDLEV